MTYITAHAGLENTKPGTWEDVEKAIELNVDILEVDVRMYEGNVYLSHDPLITAQMEQYILFDEVLERIKETKIVLNCDIKEKEVTQVVADIASRLQMEERIFFTGISDIEYLNSVSKFYYFVGLEYAMVQNENYGFTEEEVKELIFRFKKKANPYCKGFNLDYKVVNSSLIEGLQKAQIPLSCWTVDKEKDIDFLMQSRVPYITTNRVKYSMEQRRKMYESS